MKRLFICLIFIMLLCGCTMRRQSPEEATSPAGPATPPLAVTPAPAPAVTPAPLYQEQEEGQLYPVGLEQVGAVNAAGELVYAVQYGEIERIYDSDCYLIGKRTGDEWNYAIGDSKGNLLVGFEIVSCYRDVNAAVIAYSEEEWREDRAQHIRLFDVNEKRVIVDSENWPYEFDIYEVASNGETLLLSRQIGEDFYDREYFLYDLSELRAGNADPAYSYRVSVAYALTGTPYYIIRTFLDLPDQGRTTLEGLLGSDGSVLIPQGEYEEIIPRQGGGFLVKSEHQGAWIYLDGNLQEELRVSCKYAEDFRGDYARVVLFGDRYALIDRAGAIATKLYAALEPVSSYWFAYADSPAAGIAVIGPDGVERKADMDGLLAAAPGYRVENISVLGDFLCVFYESEQAGFGDEGGWEGARFLFGLLKPEDFTWLILPGDRREIYQGWREEGGPGVFGERFELIFVNRPAYPNSPYRLIDVYAPDGTLLLNGVKEVRSATREYVAFVKGFTYICMRWDGWELYREPIFLSPVMN